MLLPLIAQPVLGIAAALGVVALLVAARSPAYPVALAGLPAIVIAMHGSNPLPRGAVAVGLFAWTAIAVAFAMARDETTLPGTTWFSAPVVLALALGGLMLARLGSSPDSGYGASKLELYFAENVALLVAGIAIARRRDDFDLLVVLTLVITALAGVVLAFALAGGTAQTGVGGRYGLSPEENPIQLGRDAALGVVTAAYLLLSSRLARNRLLALAALPVTAIALTASGSRGPVLGLFLGLLVLVAMVARDRSSRRRLVLLGVGIFVAGVAVVQLVPSQNVGRALVFLQGGGSGLSSNGRVQLWSHAWDAAVAHPFFGLGTGGFASLNLGELFPHNLLLEVAAELGVAGLLLVAGLLFVSIGGLVRTWRAAVGPDRLRVSFAGALFALALTNALVSGDIDTNSTLWLAIGLIAGLAGRAEERERAPAPSAELAAAGAPRGR